MRRENWVFIPGTVFIGEKVKDTVVKECWKDRKTSGAPHFAILGNAFPLPW